MIDMASKQELKCRKPEDKVLRLCEDLQSPHLEVDVVFLNYLEIACFKGKAITWQPGVHTEVDLDDFMAFKDVYECYDKSVKEGWKTLQYFKKIMGSKKISQICVEILEKGQLEGVVQGFRRGDRGYEVCHCHDVAYAIVQQTVDSATQFPFSVMQIDQLMTEVGYKPCYEFSIHRLASETIALLQKSCIPIQPARLRLKLTIFASSMPTLLEELGDWEPLIIGRGFDFDTELKQVYKENQGFNACEDIMTKLDEALETLTCQVKFSLEIQLDPGFYANRLNLVIGLNGELEIVEVVKVPLKKYGYGL